jgi:hypothetical protein
VYAESKETKSGTGEPETKGGKKKGAKHATRKT